jgi:peroxiredoxin
LTCSVPNDHFVAKAWVEAAPVSQELRSPGVTILSDNDRQFIKILNVDQVLPYLGDRCERFVLIADDGVVSDYRIEPDPFDYNTTSPSCIISDYERKSQQMEESTVQVIE